MNSHGHCSCIIHTSQDMETIYVSTNEWIKELWFIYKMECYSAMRKKEILPFATAWMELEGIMLSEISQSEKDRYMFSLICGTCET